MQPNQNMNNMQNRTFGRTSAAPRPRPVQAPGYANPAVNNPNGAMNPDGNVVFQDKPKKSHATVYGMIFLAILAAGGIGFGVWSMLDSNAKLAKKDETIQNLNNQLANANQTTVVDDTTINVDGSSYSNPVLKASDASKSYQLAFDSSSSTTGANGANTIAITVKDGAIEQCQLGKKVFTEIGGSTTTPIADCTVSGLESNIYDIVQFGAGQDGSLNRIGFIMADGSVKYTSPINEALNNDLSIKGTLVINGQVANAVDVNVADLERGYGGYGATIFVLSDGSYLEYNDSMLAQ